MGLSPAFALEKEEELPLCSLFYAKKLKKNMTAYKDRSDKFKHCALSCQFALRCGAADSAAIGYLKELYDLISPGNAEIKDLKANAAGIRFYLTKRAINDRECVLKCDEVDWENN